MEKGRASDIARMFFNVGMNFFACFLRNIYLVFVTFAFKFKKTPMSHHSLVVDAGGTSTDWMIAETSAADAHVPVVAKTQGLNAAQLSDSQLDSMLADRALDGFRDIGSIYYYGAGCATPAICRKVRKALQRRWPSAATVEVASDLLGSARAVLGDQPGAVCILGTGSACGLYDGRLIADRVPSLGYVLGDEGSGAAIGRRLLGDWLKGLLSPDLSEIMAEHTGLTLDNVLANVYRREAPAAFLGSVTQVMSRYTHLDEVSAIITDEMGRFMDRNVMRYTSRDPGLTVSFTGSIASVFEPQLRLAADSRGVRVGRILPRPLADLANYHLSHPKQ